MPATSTFFTIEAANALLPRLRVLMQQQMERRGEIEQRLEQLSKLLGDVPSSIQIEDSDSVFVRELKQDLIERVDRYQSAWHEVEEMGAVLKDARSGLVDFYGQVDGKLVWLCWKFGEDAVTHYHRLEEGFAARKPIESTMRLRHLN